jgi:PAS domain S-box-containing protein
LLFIILGVLELTPIILNEIPFLNSQILDALSERIAVIDKKGHIIYTNQAWDYFHIENEKEFPNVKHGKKDNYLSVLKRAIELDPQLKLSYDEILNVINRKKDYYCIDFSSHSPIKRKWYTMRFTPIGDDGEVVIAHSDITERVLQESELKVVDDKLNAVISGTNTGVWEWDISLGKVHYSKEWAQQLGYSYDEIVQEFSTWERLVHPDDLLEAKKRIEAYLKGEIDTYDFVHRLKHKNGEWKHILTKVIISKRAEDGSPRYFIGTHTDVHNEKQYLKEISEYEKHFYVSMDLMCIVNIEGYLIKVNYRFVELLGYSEHDLTSQPMINFVHPDDVEKTSNLVEELIKGKETTQFINRYKCKNRNYKHLMWTAKFDPDSGFTYCSARDVTDLIKAQETSQQYFDILDNSLNEMYLICSETLSYVYANIGAQKNIGYTVKELQELTPIDLKPDISFEDFCKIVNPLLTREKKYVSFETRKLRKDGSAYIAFINLQLTKLGDKDVFIAVAIDVTERVAQETELKSTKKRLENIIDYANVGIAYANEKTEVISVNKKFAEILEYKDESKLIGQKVEDFTFPEDLAEDLSLVEEIKKGKRDSFSIEKRYVTETKKIKWVDLNVSVIRNKLGQVENFIAMVIDITEKKENQVKLIDSERNYKDIVNSFHDVILRVNSKGIIEMLSPSFERVLGYKVNESLNKMNTDYYVNKSDRALYLKLLQENGVVKHFETQVYNSKGSIVDIIANGRLYKDSYGDYGVQTVFRDVTEAKKNELKITSSEKRLKDVFDNVNDAILVTNMNSEIQEYNNAFVTLCEVEVNYGEIISNYLKSINSEKSKILRYLKQLEKDGLNSFEGEVIIGNGKTKWIDIKSSAIYDGHKKLIGVRDVIRDVTVRKEKEEIIRALTHLASTHGGKHYFNELAISLSSLLNVEYVVIGVYHEQQGEVESFGYSENGKLEENFTYSILNTPCKFTLEGQFELVESGVQKKYPKGEYLANMDADSYIGMTLFNEDKPIGLIALLDSKPIENIDFMTSILTQIKTRTETEITRTSVENLIIEREARFRGMIVNSSEITCLVDETSEVKYIAPSITKILDYSVDELLGEKLVDYIHGEDQERAFEHINSKDNLSGGYSIYRFKMKGGEYKHFRATLSNHFNTDGINGVVINAQDISELINDENERYRIALHTEEKERKRFSQDLHDGLGQTIAAASIYMNTLDDLVGSQLDTETYEIFKTGKDLVNKSAKETRMVSHNIMPPSLTQFGLSDSLSEMINNYQKIKDNVNITFKSNILKHRFTHEVELSLYRVVQELVNNSLKHSKAKHIDVTLSVENYKCRIVVRDDGVGFDYALIKKDKKAGIGLINIEQRIHIVGGVFEINNQKKGIEFVITL